MFKGFCCSLYLVVYDAHLLSGLGLVVVPLGVAVDELVALRGHVAQGPVPVRHPVRQELEQIVNPGTNNKKKLVNY